MSASTGSGVRTSSFMRPALPVSDAQTSTQVVVRDRRAARRARQHRLEREHEPRTVEVGRVQVEPQQPARGERARADAERRAAAARAPARRDARSRPTSRSSVAHQSKSSRELAAQHRRVGVRGRDEAARPTPASISILRPASMLACVASASMCANSASGPWRRSRPAGPARRCWKPCCAIASPRSRQSSSQAARSGRRWKNGCRSGAGITSSVARSMPWSSSQSRISAQRSNVAGSTSWIATAMRRSRAARATPYGAVVTQPPARPPPSARARGSSPRRGRPGTASQVRSRTAASPPRASRSRIAREPASPATAPPSASARGAHSSPLRPSAISSAGPPAATATTGRPDACASSTTWPNVSVAEQNRKTSAEAYVAASASPSSQPRNVAARPSRARSRSSSGPPPASTRCSRDRARGQRGTRRRAGRRPSRA